MREWGPLFGEYGTGPRGHVGGFGCVGCTGLRIVRFVGRTGLQVAQGCGLHRGVGCTGLRATQGCGLHGVVGCTGLQVVQDCRSHEAASRTGQQLARGCESHVTASRTDQQLARTRSSYNLAAPVTRPGRCGGTHSCKLSDYVFDLRTNSDNSQVYAPILGSFPANCRIMSKPPTHIMTICRFWTSVEIFPMDDRDRDRSKTYSDNLQKMR